uniref:Thyroglobulin type-1 domain-containing protein n=1 Tax=Macrostomum lignano TaxID=282301 RepID=A0A1I8FDD7_9PLAT
MTECRVSEHLVTLSCDGAPVQTITKCNSTALCCQGSLQCFGECSPICNMQSDGSCPVIDPILVSGVSCDRTVRPPDAKTVSLTVDTRLSRLAGAWSCKFRGAVSATVDLTAYVMKTTFAPTQPMAYRQAWRGCCCRVATDSAPPPQPTWASGSRTSGGSQPDLAATQDDFDRHPNFMSASLLLLNLGFCVRCILARHYVDIKDRLSVVVVDRCPEFESKKSRQSLLSEIAEETRRRNQRKPLGWLGSCLCVSTVQVDLTTRPRQRTGSSAPRPEATPARGPGCGRDEHRLPESAAFCSSSSSSKQQCLYCMQTDCRILYDDVARTGSELRQQLLQRLRRRRCRRAHFECRPSAGRGGAGSISMSGVPKSLRCGRDVDREADAASSMGQQDDAGGSDISASGGGAGSRLALSRRMLRKADTLLREANSLLLDLRSAAAPNKSSSLAVEEPAAANRDVEGDRCVREV